MAALLSAQGKPQHERPDPAFLTRLHEQLRAGAPQEPTSLNRRGFLAAGLAGLAAGITGGAGLSKLATPAPAVPSAPSAPSPIVRDNGRWFPVARLSSLPHDTVMRFSAGALEGNLIKDGDNLYALSSVCSHLPCSLLYQEKPDNFLCPCHNATFTKAGNPTRVGSSYPALTHIQVSVKDDQVLVWSIDAAPPPPPPPPDATSGA